MLHTKHIYHRVSRFSDYHCSYKSSDSQTYLASHRSHLGSLEIPALAYYSHAFQLQCPGVGLGSGDL